MPPERSIDEDVGHVRQAVDAKGVARHDLDEAHGVVPSGVESECIDNEPGLA